MNFGKIDTFLIFGGGGTNIPHFAAELIKRGHQVCIFTSVRHLEEELDGGKTYQQMLEFAGIKYISTSDINACPELLEMITETSIGLAIGEVWKFNSEIIDSFGGRLLAHMGIPLPRYRGGAHYTWQILAGDHAGTFCLEVINEKTTPGLSDSGLVLFRHDFEFPESCRTVQDYYDLLQKKNLACLLEFADLIEKGTDFEITELDESTCSYFPRLNTRLHAWINWQWNKEEIAAFIRAFSDPYPGAGTFLDGCEVRIKSVDTTDADGTFHPFQAGLIYRVDEKDCYVCCRNGSVIISEITDGDGNPVGLSLGQRFFTPSDKLDDAMQRRVDYNADGLKKY